VSLAKAAEENASSTRTEANRPKRMAVESMWEDVTAHPGAKALYLVAL
jgi:hypothetical protein